MDLNPENLSFHVVNLGCRVNRVEADSIAARLISSGVPRAPRSVAGVVIVNSCTVTAEADAKTRKAVRHTLAVNHAAQVIVTGCAAMIDPEALRALGERVIVEPNKTLVPGLVHELLGIPESVDTAAASVSLLGEPDDESFARAGEGFMARAGIKVQDGCDNACTFCIVHKARGPLWSKPVAEVVDEVVRAEKAGLGEVVLTGVNLGRYAGGCALSELIERLLDATNNLRVRLSSIEPPEVDEQLIGLLANSNGRLCRFLHMPLQSGCSRTLKEMGRLYDAEEFRSLCKCLYSEVPGIALSTDVIAGFPGETEDDFEESFALCREIGFSRMHVFRYSMRPGTPAAVHTDQVDPRVKAERASRLRELAVQMRGAFADGLIGNKEKLCMTASDTGMSERFFSGVIAGSDDAQRGRGELVDVTVTGRDGDMLICEPS